MPKSFALALALVFASGLACQSHADTISQSPPQETARKKALTAFASDEEIRNLFRELAEQQQQQQARMRAKPLVSGALGLSKESSPAGAPPPAPAVPAAPRSADAKASAESVTNTQTAGVDEGGIVKVHGKHLVMLRRGRLFTVNVDQGQLKAVSSIDAYAPGSDPSGSWYDEMLISDNLVVVIGYSYSRGGTEIGLFDIEAGGQLSYRATYHMRSNDYYSSRNYASRLIGSKLIFYTPLYINPWQPDPFSAFPAMRKWHAGATAGEFKRIAPATHVYRTDEPLDPNAGMALHTVSICDLAKREMECDATAVLGPPGRVFYVSADSVYVWTTAASYANNEYKTRSGVFRIPLSGQAPTALKVSGAPVDQLSFLESDDRHLNVLVRSDGRGEGMWGAEGKAGSMALLRVSLSLFSDGKDSAPPNSYKRLPTAPGYALQNRYVGNYLLYGTGAGWGSPPTSVKKNVYAVRWDDDSGALALRLPHGIDRIEAMGANAVVIGTGGRDLYFSSIELTDEPSVANQYKRENAAQGETRSHGFFYKSENANEGMIGLPIARGGRPGSHQLNEGSAAVLFLRNSSLKLSEMGELASSAGIATDDGCRASCVDWYGNARPLFLRNRVFALMGYELVEGRVDGNRIEEIRRISYAPTAARIAR